MKVLVTGASGMIGSALTTALLARGDEVVALTRDLGRARAEQPAIEWHQWAPERAEPPAAAFDGVDAIVNLIGERLDQRWTETAKRRIVESRRDTTAALARTAARMAQKPDVVVSGSAVGIYGHQGDRLLDESSEPVESGFESETVRLWEEAAEGFSNLGIRLVKLRTGPVLDRSGGMLARFLLPFRFGVGGPIAGGDQYISWIHIADEIGIILMALDSAEAAGPINSTAPNPVTNREFAKTLGRVMKRPALVPVPGFAIDIMFGSEMAATVKRGQRVVPTRARELGYEFRQPELEGALADLL